jgi:hypothetical protein
MRGLETPYPEVDLPVQKSGSNDYDRQMVGETMQAPNLENVVYCAVWALESLNDRDWSCAYGALQRELRAFAEEEGPLMVKQTLPVLA